MELMFVMFRPPTLQFSILEITGAATQTQYVLSPHLPAPHQAL